MNNICCGLVFKHSQWFLCYFSCIDKKHKKNINNDKMFLNFLFFLPNICYNFFECFAYITTKPIPYHSCNSYRFPSPCVFDGSCSHFKTAPANTLRLLYQTHASFVLQNISKIIFSFPFFYFMFSSCLLAPPSLLQTLPFEHITYFPSKRNTMCILYVIALARYITCHARVIY